MHRTMRCPENVVDRKRDTIFPLSHKRVPQTWWSQSHWTHANIQIAGATTSGWHSCKEQGSTRTLREHGVEKVEREAKAGECPRAPLGHTSGYWQRPYRPKRSSTACTKYGASARWPYPESSDGMRILPTGVEIHRMQQLPRRPHRHTTLKNNLKIRKAPSGQCPPICSSESGAIR